MSTKFVFHGNDVQVIEYNDKTAFDRLPPQLYTVKHNPFRGFYLEVLTEEVKLPPRVYGNVAERVHRCITAFEGRDGSTGVLLTGHKGTGKTLLLLSLANTVVNRLDLPVVMIRSSYSGTEFESFMQHVGPCCVLFDEFGKMYGKDDKDGGQPALLSFLDGIDKTKRLIVLTENSEHRINEFLLNRPGRLYYHFKYRKLDEASIVGYCQDHEVSSDLQDEILDMARRSRIFSFDILQTLIEECHRFNIDAKTAVRDLNIDIFSFTQYIRIISIQEKENPERVIVPKKDVVIQPDSDSEYDSYTEIPVLFRDKAEAVEALGEKEEMTPEERHLMSILGRNIENDEITIQDHHLSFQDTEKMIYDTGPYVITAKPTKRPPVSALY